MTLIDLSANCNVTSIGLSSPKLNYSYYEYGIEFTLAPRSTSAFLMEQFPIVQEIVITRKSFNLGGVIGMIIVLTYLVKTIFLNT